VKEFIDGIKHYMLYSIRLDSRAGRTAQILFVRDVFQQRICTAGSALQICETVVTGASDQLISWHLPRQVRLLLRHRTDFVV
jgi:hypothetical protein